MHDKNKQVIVHFCGSFIMVVISASIMHAIEYDNELQGARDYSAAVNEVNQFLEVGEKTYELYCGSKGSADTCAPTSTTLTAAKDYWDARVADKFATTETSKAGGSTINVLGLSECSGTKANGCFTIIDPAMSKKIKQVAQLEDWDDAGGSGYWVVEDGKKNHTGEMKEAAYNWALPSSVFFAMTIVSTIGYGTFSPSTSAGMCFTMFYAIFSIAYFGYFLTITSDRILEFIKYVSKKIKGKKYRLTPVVQLKIVSFSALAYLILLAVGGPVFDDWRYTDSLYFAVITFTTIGLGDYAPSFSGTASNSFRAAGYFTYALATLFGLALLSAFLGGISDVFQNVRVTMVGVGGRRRKRLARESIEKSMRQKEKD